MNIIKLQDILKGVPDNRLQGELQNPTGSIPQYLVLSEVVRRDKLRQGMSTSPSQSSVLEDAMAKAQPAPAPQQMQEMQQPPQGQPEQAPAGYADGGFISPNNAMAQSGVRGFDNVQKPPQQQIQLGSSGHSMFAPNMNPKPAPMVNAPINVSSQGYQPDNFEQDGYESNKFSPNAMARGGIVALKDGDRVNSQPTKAEIIAYIRDAAVKRGMDPDIAVKVAYSEGLSANPEGGYQSNIRDKSGKREESYGVFQLNMNPGAVGDQMLRKTGVHPSQDVFKGIDFALDTANKVGWSPWMGAAAVGIRGKTGTAGGPAGDVSSPPADTSAASEGHSPEVVADIAKSKDKSWMSSIGDMLGGDAVKMGKILMDKPAERIIPLLDESISGDPSAAAKTRSRSPAEIIAAYQGLRGSYMADGGSVQRMADGPGAGAVRADPTPEEIAQMTPEQLQQLSPGVLDRVMSGLSSAAGAVGRGALSAVDWARENLSSQSRPTPESAARNEEIRQRAIAEGYTIVPYSPEQRIEAAKRYGVVTDPGLTPDQRAAAAKQYNAGDVEAARIAEEARIAAETPAPAAEVPAEIPEAPKEKGVYDLLREMQKESGTAEQAYYDQMIAMEEEKNKQSGGLGGFLRQMGLGMMASPGSLQQQLTGGLYAAGTAREEQKGAMADKINTLILAKKKADIDAIKARTQLQIDEMTGGQLTPKEKAQYTLDALTKQLDAYTKAGNTEMAELVQKTIDSTLKDLGINVQTFLPTDEAGVEDASQGFFQEYFPSFFGPSK